MAVGNETSTADYSASHAASPTKVPTLENCDSQAPTLQPHRGQSPSESHASTAVDAEDTTPAVTKSRGEAAESNENSEDQESKNLKAKIATEKFIKNFDAAQPNGKSVNFEQFIKDHPEHQESLRVIHAAQSQRRKEEGNKSKEVALQGGRWKRSFKKLGRKMVPLKKQKH